MEKAVLNVETLNVTQGMNGSYSHKGDLAIDIGSACKYLKAPFTGTIKRIYTNCNAVWLESNEKVKYADGTEDYMTILTIHDDDVSNLKVGKVIKQNEIYYHPGKKGKVTGSHIHIAIGKGKFSGTGWYENKYGSWCINNQYNIVKALFLYDKVKIQNAMYDWKKTSDFVIGYNVGDKVRIETCPPYKYYIADDVQKVYGIWQVRENLNAGGASAFDWRDNGIPEACLDKVDANGNKTPDSDRVHLKRGDKFVFAKTFTIKAKTRVNGKDYVRLSYTSNGNYDFWVVTDYLKKV